MSVRNVNGDGASRKWGQISYVEPLSVLSGNTQFEKDHRPSAEDDLHPLLGITLRVQYQNERMPRKFQLLGAYADRRDLVVIFRYSGQPLMGTRPFVTLSQVLNRARNKLRVRSLRADEWLRLEDRWRFNELPGGARFRIGGRSWTKMSRVELRALARGNVFGIAS